MIFVFFLSIVFIAELIIAIFAITKLLQWNKKIIDFNRLLNKNNPKIKEIMVLVHKLSEQMIDIANMAVDKTKDYAFEFLAKQLKSILTTALVFKIKSQLKAKLHLS